MHCQNIISTVLTKHNNANLYYYSSPVRKNMSSTFDGFLADRSQFDIDHRVDFYAHTCCQSSISGPLFAFYCPLFFTKKIINNVAFRQMRCLRCTFRVRCRHRSTPDESLDGDTVYAERVRVYNNCRNGSCLTWLATSLEEKRRWLIIDASPRGQCSK